MGMWQIEMEPIKDWLDGLDKQTAYQVYAALDLLRERGLNLKRPLVGKIEGSIIGSIIFLGRVPRPLWSWVNAFPFH